MLPVPPGAGSRLDSRGARLMAEMVNIFVDGNPIAVEKGTLVIEAARRLGIMIPHFCYHPKIKPDANCRMCLVEVEKMPKLQTSCSTIATEGMSVRTATRDRKS